MSPLEEAVANLLQFEKLLNPQGSACGFREVITAHLEANDADQENEQVENFMEALPSTSRASSGANKKTLKTEVIALVKEQKLMQEQHFEESRKVWTEI